MANWYETDPDKAQEVLGQINAKRKEYGQADLSGDEIEQAKQALGGETFDPAKLDSVLSYITKGSGGPPTGGAEPKPTTAVNPWTPTSTAKGPGLITDWADPGTIRKATDQNLPPAGGGDLSNDVWINGMPDRVNYEGNTKPGTYTNPNSPYNLGVAGSPPTGWTAAPQPTGPEGSGGQTGSHGFLGPLPAVTLPPGPSGRQPYEPLKPDDVNILGDLGGTLGPFKGSNGDPLPADGGNPSTRMQTGIPELGGQGGEMFRFLMDRAKQRLHVDATDPTIRDQVDSVRAEQTREARKYLSGLAESAGPNANIGAESRSANEKIGQNTSAFQAGLMAQEIAARRVEIQNALTGAQGLLTSQQQMQLTEELANLDRAEKQYEYKTSLQEGARQFDTSTEVGRQQFLASLLNNRDQFGRTLSQRGYEFDTSQANDLLKNTRQMTLQEALAQLQLAQRAYEFDTTERRLNSPLAGG